MTDGYERHVNFKFLLQYVLEVTAPVRHHLRQPNLLQVHDGPADQSSCAPAVAPSPSRWRPSAAGLWSSSVERLGLCWTDSFTVRLFSSVLTVRLRPSGLCFKTALFSRNVLPIRRSGFGMMLQRASFGLTQKNPNL